MKLLKLTIFLILILLKLDAFSKTVRIAVNGIKFIPADTTVAVGDVVEWYSLSTTNKHTITSKNIPADAVKFDEGFTGSAPLFRYTVKVPGKYEYICKPHEELKMIGSFTATSVTGIDLNNSIHGITLYPNPVKNELNILLDPATTYQLTITDTKGEAVYSVNISATNNHNVNTEIFTQGIYFVYLKSNEDQARICKFIKE